jgi:hypothetical protein
MDHIDALIAATPARALNAIRLKAGICHDIARGIENWFSRYCACTRLT